MGPIYIESITEEAKNDTIKLNFINECRMGG